MTSRWRGTQWNSALANTRSKPALSKLAASPCTKRAGQPLGGGGEHVGADVDADDLGFGKGAGEFEAREAGAAAEIEDPARRTGNAGDQIARRARPLGLEAIIAARVKGLHRLPLKTKEPASNAGSSHAHTLDANQNL